MADWTAPPTASVGDVLTALYLNTYVRDNTPFFDYKTTTKTVNTTVAETDLFNGEIVIPANAMGLNQRLIGWADFDVLNTTGGAVSAPRLKLKIGAAVPIDTGAGPNLQSSGTRGAGWCWFVIQQLGATNAQVVTFEGWILDGTEVNLTAGSGVNRLASNALSGRVMKGRATAAVDMTSSQTLALTTINGSAGATCETKLTAAKIVIGI
jgi:hypothetical protein